MPLDMTMNIDDILLKNENKNFVQRLMSPSKYPFIKNPDGSYSTHLMSSGEVEGKGISYPNIIQDIETKLLKQLEPKDAMDYAVKNKEYIEFPTSEEAEWFSTNYKNNSYWSKNQRELAGN